VIDAAGWLALGDRDGQARRFANDALWFGQQACSSPRFVFWRGEANTVEAAAADFRPRVERAAAGAALNWSPRAAVDKFVAEQLHASRGEARIRETASNRVRVVQASAFAAENCLGAADGFFIEQSVVRLADPGPLIERQQWQTIVSIGVPAADWRISLAESRPHGIDRIVPPGAALDFSKVWDG
jgi:hypothetical protein